MSKKSFRTPSLDDLSSGNILDIYSNSKQQEGWLGKARLIEYSPSAFGDENPYIRKEIGGTDRRSPQIIVWSRQRWLIEFVEGPLSGHITHRYIAYFACVGVECLRSLNN